MDRTFSESIAQYIQPVILVNSSPSVEAISLKSGLTFTEQLRPFFQPHASTPALSIKTLSGSTKEFKHFAYRLLHNTEFQSIRSAQLHHYIKFRLGTMLSLQENQEQSLQSHQQTNTSPIPTRLKTPEEDKLAKISYNEPLGHLFLTPLSANHFQLTNLLGLEHNIPPHINTKSRPIFHTSDKSINLAQTINSFTTSNSDIFFPRTNPCNLFDLPINTCINPYIFHQTSRSDTMV